MVQKLFVFREKGQFMFLSKIAFPIFTIHESQQGPAEGKQHRGLWKTGKKGKSTREWHGFIGTAVFSFSVSAV